MTLPRETNSPPLKIAIVGGGAAGFFAGINCAEMYQDVEVTVFEGTRQLLYKVGISGGGRCNVTHACFEPEELVRGYPRGNKELLGVYRRFQPRNTIDWFAKHGVKLKTEDDGRMFPVTDHSETIIECLRSSASTAGVTVRTGTRVTAIRRIGDGSSCFEVALKSGETDTFDRVLIATGSSPQGYKFAEALGHSIVPCVPSLFTFNVEDPRLQGLAGLSFASIELSLIAGDKRLHSSGPALITHWGLSGPAVLRLSAWGARLLYLSRYQADLKINWVPEFAQESLDAFLHARREEHPKRAVLVDNFLPVPRRFWERIVGTCAIDRDTTWSHLTKTEMQALTREFCAGEYRILGKGEFKEEFVTCGGVKLKEVDFHTMESRTCPGLYFAGEVLDIDGITGGYNFQSAWTTGWIAGISMGLKT